MINPFLHVARDKHIIPPPIWIMRQAGRYLPEYRELRSTSTSFMEFCYAPDKASEATLQPLRRFALDAAIMFSDILVIPDALGIDVHFEKGHGPKLSPTYDDNPNNMAFDVSRLEPVYNGMRLVKKALPQDKAFLGFAGAPWTLATYMIEGGGSRDFTKTKTFVYEHRAHFSKLIDTLVSAVSQHVIKQIEAGADAIQLFDSWAGVLPENEITRWCIEPIARIVHNVKSVYPDIPILGFPKAIGIHIPEFVRQTKVDVIAVDMTTPLSWVKDQVDIPIQGNLDPLLLASDKDKALAKAKDNIKVMQDHPFIFNLGHGIVPHTPIDHVTALVELVKHG